MSSSAAGDAAAHDKDAAATRHVDFAAATGHSLMKGLPPRPPSPYNAKQRRFQEERNSSVTAGFMRGRRDLRITSAIPGAAAALAAVANQTGTPRKAITATATTVEESPIKNALALVSAEPEAREAAAHDPIAWMEAEAEEALFELFFRDAQRHYYITTEENLRNGILANEEVGFTSIVIEALQQRAELLAGNEAAELVIKEAQQRAEARRAMMQEIEQDVALQLRDARIAEFLSIQFEALLPAHTAGRERILHEEVEDLRAVFHWHKENRPLGASRHIRCPGSDYRSYTASNRTGGPSPTRSPRALVRGSRAVTAVRTSRDYLAELLQRTAASRGPASVLAPLAITSGPDSSANSLQPVAVIDGTLPASDEIIFESEGRALLQMDKDRRFTELRDKRHATDLMAAAAQARGYVLAEEAMCWMQITRLSVDGIYEAQEEARLWQKREAAAGAAAADRELQKQAVRDRLMKQRGILPPTASAAPAAAAADAPTTPALGTESISAPGTQEPPTTPATGAEAAAAAQLRKSSGSTVADNFSPTSISLVASRGGAEADEEEAAPEAPALEDAEEDAETVEECSATPEEAEAEADGSELAHLRLVTGAMADPEACKQLSALADTELTDGVSGGGVDVDEAEAEALAEAFEAAQDEKRDEQEEGSDHDEVGDAEEVAEAYEELDVDADANADEECADEL